MGSSLNQGPFDKGAHSVGDLKRDPTLEDYPCTASDSGISCGPEVTAARGAGRYFWELFESPPSCLGFQSLQFRV